MIWLNNKHPSQNLLLFELLNLRQYCNLLSVQDMNYWLYGAMHQCMSLLLSSSWLKGENAWKPPPRPTLMCGLSLYVKTKLPPPPNRSLLLRSPSMVNCSPLSRVSTVSRGALLVSRLWKLKCVDSEPQTRYQRNE